MAYQFKKAERKGISVLSCGSYAVRDDGVVLSRKNNRWGLSNAWRPLRPARGKNGYLMVALNGKTEYVHSLVCSAFHGDRKHGDEVRHLNGIKTDNRVSNLAWGSRQENMLDSAAMGRTNRGTKLRLSKLNEQAVVVIRFFKNIYPQRLLAGLFGVSRATIANIQRGETWGWLD